MALTTLNTILSGQGKYQFDLSSCLTKQQVLSVTKDIMLSMPNHSTRPEHSMTDPNQFKYRTDAQKRDMIMNTNAVLRGGAVLQSITPEVRDEGANSHDPIHAEERKAVEEFLAAQARLKYILNLDTLGSSDNIIIGMLKMLDVVQRLFVPERECTDRERYEQITNVFRALGYDPNDPNVKPDIDHVIRAFASPDYTPFDIVEALAHMYNSYDSIITVMTNDKTSHFIDSNVTETIAVYNETLNSIAHRSPFHTHYIGKFAEQVELEAMTRLAGDNNIIPAHMIEELRRNQRNGEGWDLGADPIEPLSGVMIKSKYIGGNNVNNSFVNNQSGGSNWTNTAVHSATATPHIPNNGGPTIPGIGNPTVVNNNNYGYQTPNNNANYGNNSNNGINGIAYTSNVTGIHGASGPLPANSASFGNTSTYTLNNNNYARPQQTTYQQPQAQNNQNVIYDQQGNAYVMMQPTQPNPQVVGQPINNQTQYTTATTTGYSGTNYTTSYSQPSVTTYGTPIQSTVDSINPYSKILNNNTQSTVINYSQPNTSAYGTPNQSAYAQTQTTTSPYGTPVGSGSPNLHTNPAQPRAVQYPVPQFRVNGDRIIPEVQSFPELGNRGIGIESLLNDPDNPFLSYSLRKSLYDDAEVTAKIRNKPINRSDSPFWDQGPLNFVKGDNYFLEDLTNLDPATYNNLLDDYIRNNMAKLTGINLTGQIDDTLRNIFKAWLWVLNKRAHVLGGDTDSPYFMMPMLVQEYVEVLNEMSENKAQWSMIESEWVNEMRRYPSADTEQKIADLNNPQFGNNVRMTVIQPWWIQRQNYLKRNPQGPSASVVAGYGR